MHLLSFPKMKFFKHVIAHRPLSQYLENKSLIIEQSENSFLPAITSRTAIWRTFSTLTSAHRQVEEKIATKFINQLAKI